MCLCVYSLDHGEEIRITAGLRKCRSTITFTHTHLVTLAFFLMFLSSCVQMPVISHWIQTQQTLNSFCLMRTRRSHMWKIVSRILIIQRDLMMLLRFCVLRVWLDAVTGRLNGAEGMLKYQCHIKEYAGKEEKTVCLDTMTNPGVCTALITDSLSITIITEPIYLLSIHHPRE